MFDAIVEEFGAFAARLDISDVTFIPISALLGDNVVERSQAMGWYQGPPLLYHLEHVHIASDRNLIDARFPVQWVIRVGGRQIGSQAHDYRAYAGQLAGGILRPGDDVVVLPGGQRSSIAGIDSFDGPVSEAFPPMSVALRLSDDIDISRGSMIVRSHNQPTVATGFESLLCWMSERPLDPRRRYLVKHTTRTVPAGTLDVRYRIDVNTLHRDETATTLELNDLGRVHLQLGSPLVFDSYRRNRPTGGLIVIDQDTNETVAAGVILDTESESDGAAEKTKTERSPNVRWEGSRLTRTSRWESIGHAGATIWFTGLPGAGKSTIATAVEERLVVHRAPGVPARRRQPAPRPQRRSRVRRGRALRERAPHRPRRPAVRGVGDGRARQPRQPLRMRSRGGGQAARRRRARVPRGVRGRAPGGLRAA